MELTPEIKRAILIGMARQNDRGFVRGEELNISDADIQAMEAARWLQPLAHGDDCLPIARRSYLGVA